MRQRYIAGLRAIGEYMGWSPTKVKRMCLKYGFPLMRMPASGRMGWKYHVNPNRITQWEMEREVEAREHLAALPSAKHVAIREAPKPTPAGGCNPGSQPPIPPSSNQA